MKVLKIIALGLLVVACDSNDEFATNKGALLTPEQIQTNIINDAEFIDMILLGPAGKDGISAHYNNLDKRFPNFGANMLEIGRKSNEPQTLNEQGVAEQIATSIRFNRPNYKPEPGQCPGRECNESQTYTVFGCHSGCQISWTHCEHMGATMCGTILSYCLDTCCSMMCE